MSQMMSVQCGFCRNRFMARPDQRGHDVRCPHCKMVVRVPAATQTAVEAAQSFKDLIPEKREVSARRPPVQMRGGVRSQGLAILWVVLLALGLIGAVVAIVVIQGRRGAGGTSAGAGGTASTAPGTGTPGGAAAPGAAAGMASAGSPGAGAAAAQGEQPRPRAPIEVDVKRLLGGYKGSTLTYALGRVTNNTPSLLKVLKVIVAIQDEEGKDIGEAAGILLNVPPGAVVPLVAEWAHEQGAGVRGRKWVPGYELNPAGVAQDLPAILADEPWAVRDPNSLTPTGRVTFKALNKGLLPVTQVEVLAILLDREGKIVGAVKSTVDQKLEPNTTTEVTARWDQCPGHLVAGAEVWVQPAF